MASVSGLRLFHRFVDELPGDPITENRRRQVHEACWSRVTPTQVSAPRLLALVPEVAALLDLSTEETPELVEVLAGNRVLPGMIPYAACYGGHQFGNWAGQLGDGRAITLGEVQNAAGHVWEVQLKGAGPTPYSRTADGRAVLRSSLRELVCSEAMFHLGVPGTRALSLVTTGEPVLRDLLYDGHPEHEPGAIVCRVARTFLRFGNFEIFAGRDDKQTLRRLVDHTIHHHFPQRAYASMDRPPCPPEDIVAFFGEVCRRTARLMVQWMRVGFVHGVMNTDNMSIVGDTIDYGPYGWVEPYDLNWTPNTTDAGGRRYRYGNQPRIAHWNLLKLGEALSLLLEEKDVPGLQHALDAYVEVYNEESRAMQLAKLGLGVRTDQDDGALLEALPGVLSAIEIDFPLFYRTLAHLEDASDDAARFASIAGACYAPERATSDDVAKIGGWLGQWQARSRVEGLPIVERARRMDAVNPLYVPRNWIVQEVIEKTEATGDRAPLAELLEVLRRPYEAQPGREHYAEKRPEWARNRPGCSMLSCSS